jgi:hypothetical protein
MAHRSQIIKNDLLVLVFDTKTGRVSTNAGPYRELKVALPPLEPTAPGKPPEEPPPPGPVDDYICARRMGEPTADCRIYMRVNGVFYDTGIPCSNAPICYILP